MSSQIASTVPLLGMTLGTVYIGATVAAMQVNLIFIFLSTKISVNSFFGISNLQMVIYYKNYPDDSWIYRYSVAIIWILDALHVALSTHAVYHYLIDLFGNYLGLYHIVWSFKGSICVLFAMAATSDFIIVFSMCYYLHKSREASTFSSTSDMLYGLMRLVVISGLAMSTCSLLTLITYLVWQDSLIFLGVDLILPNLYVNSLLAM
ncbi:hypothetical protein EDD85DRAFT_958559 [Armillaria nabsnona]|nr:hypothetical protein EDD85DRAFT_958559 [Armillaria nabsnona]